MKQIKIFIHIYKDKSNKVTKKKTSFISIINPTLNVSDI